MEENLDEEDQSDINTKESDFTADVDIWAQGSFIGSYN
jgi:hypothetical protein